MQSFDRSLWRRKIELNESFGLFIKFKNKYYFKNTSKRDAYYNVCGAVPSLNAQIIDTPGIKEFGILAIESYELKNFFKEFVPFLNECKFDNCIHVNEPQCKVIDALNEGKIAPWRYLNYLNILDDISDQAKKWELKKRG